MAAVHHLQYIVEVLPEFFTANAFNSIL